MKTNYLKVAVDVLLDMAHHSGRFVVKNIPGIIYLINFLVPYIIALVVYRGVTTGTIGNTYIWLLLPLIMSFIVSYVRRYANKVNIGDQVPVPTQRFTKVQSNGIVVVDKERVQEMLLYVADLEDWLESNVR